jgi:hypothetical protein
MPSLVADAGLVSVTADAQRRRVRLEAVLADLDSPTSPNTTPTKGKTS